MVYSTMFKTIRNILGRSMAYAGAALVDLVNPDAESYDEMNWCGKIGHNLMIFGFAHSGFPIKKLDEAIDAYLKAKAEDT